MCSITSNCITGTKILVVLVVCRCYAGILTENSWGKSGEVIQAISVLSWNMRVISMIWLFV